MFSPLFLQLDKYIKKTHSPFARHIGHLTVLIYKKDFIYTSPSTNFFYPPPNPKSDTLTKNKIAKKSIYSTYIVWKRDTPTYIHIRYNSAVTIVNGYGKKKEYYIYTHAHPVVKGLRELPSYKTLPPAQANAVSGKWQVVQPPNPRPQVSCN